MNATYQINADDLNLDLLQSIKKTFKGKEIEISISDLEESDFLKSAPRNVKILLDRINDITMEKNFITFTTEEFEKLL